MPAHAMTVAADGAVCLRCGAINPCDTRWRVTIDGRTRGFCCAGCVAVAQTIDAAGFQSFYAQRTGSSSPISPVDSDVEQQRRRIADAACAAGLVQNIGNNRYEAALLIDGISCGACVWLLESWLARQSGIVQASVNFATRRALVAWDAAATNLPTILAAVDSIGYRAHPYDPARREALARRESRMALARAAVALLAMMQVMMFSIPAYVGIDGIEPMHQRLLDWASLSLTLPVMLFSAVPFFRGAWRDVRNHRAGMDVPVALGVAAAFGASMIATVNGGGAVYYDSVTMFVALLSLARWLETVARHRAGAALEAAARSTPAVAERLSDWPTCVRAETVAATALACGDFILVRPGATIAADGVIADGRGSVDEAVLTGESRPRPCVVGDAVMAGSIVRDTALIVEVHAAGAATRLAAIVRLTERAAMERPRLAQLADRAAGAFVVALLLAAAIAAVVWMSIVPSRALAFTFA